MKKVNQTLLKITERVVRVEVDKEKKVWPPICATLLHQPKRPTTKDN